MRFPPVTAFLICIIAFPLGVFIGLRLGGMPHRNFDDETLLGFDRIVPAVPNEATQVETETSDRGSRGPLPEIPTGPPTELYRKHMFSSANFRLISDSHIYNPVTTFPTLTEPTELANWRKRVSDFRLFLLQAGLSTTESLGVGQRLPFIDSLDMTEIMTENLNKCDRSRCPSDLRCRPVVDMALVIPMAMRKYKAAWAVLESIRQFTVLPRELVFVIGGMESSTPIEHQIFVNVVRDIYLPDFPEITRVKIYGSEEIATPGDARWFGFNQTDSEIVTLFDNDDYMHPQFVHIFWRIFRRRPELDFALMQYEVSEFDKDCEAKTFHPSVQNFLTKRQYTDYHISQAESYPDSKYKEVWDTIPTFKKTWWLGNTDAEPNWETNQDQKWFDGPCANGWATFRRHVMDMVSPPVDIFGGEDAIWNYRVARAGFNYRCIPLVVGVYLKDSCEGMISNYS